MIKGLWRSAGLPNNLAEALARRQKLPVRVAKWLQLRGVTTDEQVREWLMPATQWMSPWLFADMEAAVTRILQATVEREKICIVGDYDVDGVTASAILASTLAVLDANWFCLIPHRVEDGYGLSEKLVNRAAEQGAQLIVTVDNGIAALEAISHAGELGLDVIVTDHHEPLAQLPTQAVAMVHWCQSQCEELTQLSGAGVAWKLATALLERSGWLDSAQKRLGNATKAAGVPASVSASHAEELQSWQRGLAALGALADVMPMRGENRGLVRSGLTALRESRRPGWRALCSVAGVDATRVSDRSLLWSITPRINAAGRMGSAQMAFALLMASSDIDALPLADQLEAWNDARKRETARAVDEATKWCQAQFGDEAPAALALAGPWSLGVVGIVAAKLTEQFERPVVVFADDGGSVLRGSGRAPEGFPLHAAVQRCAAHLVHFGGHEAAIGCAVQRDAIEPFAQAFQDSARVARAEQPLLAEHTLADDYLPLSEATMEMLEWLERFAPHGPGNPELTFYIGPVELLGVTRMGQGNHLRLRVKEGKTSLELVWFHAPAEAAGWPAQSWMAATVFMERNEWKGTSRVQLRVKQAHLLEGLISRDEFGYLYRLLRSRRALAMEETHGVLPAREAKHTQVVLDTFVELGFAEQGQSAYHVVEQVALRDLRDSLHYQQHLRQAMINCSLGKELRHESIL